MVDRQLTLTQESSRVDEELELLRRTLAYARDQNYTGWDYGDGMSSKLLQEVPVENKWLNLVVQETIKRAPINVRPLFRVDQRRNFKGSALFVLANLNTFELTTEEQFRDEAAALGKWLVNHESDRCPEFCGSHRHDLQGLSGKEIAGTPGIVGTTYGVLALLAAAEVIDEGYADIAHTASGFVFDRLDYEEIDDGARIKYKTTDSGEHYTLNANALGARLLIELYRDRSDPNLLDGATKILDYVVSRQTKSGGWNYRDPPSASHLSMDNHHNGFIIESLLRYQNVVDSNRYQSEIEESMTFYRRVLFEDNGAPNWDESSAYPRDIHAAAQGIVVFTIDGNLTFAKRIIDWVIDHLYAGGGRFYFRKHRFYTKRITLMRWCQAWMAYALSEYKMAIESKDRPFLET